MSIIVKYFISNRIIQPLVLVLFIQNFDKQITLMTYFYATSFIFLIVLDVMMFNHISFALRKLGIAARVACTSLVYRKVK